MYKIIGGDGREYGPVTVEQLRQWLREGRANAQTQVLAPGATTWQRLGDVPEFNAAPPPVPPVAGVATTAHQLTEFPVALVILLHFVTCGIFTFIWLNLMHGKMPRVRSDDPSAGKAIGFCFIPFYNLYWIFFTYRRLCDRIAEQRELYGLAPNNQRGLATAACILQVIPYINLLFGMTIMLPVFAGVLQASVNELVRTSAGRAPQRSLPASTLPAAGVSGGMVVAIVCACLIPFIGLMAALAIPGFVKARKQSQARRIINDTRQMDAAIDQWALERGKESGNQILTNEVAAFMRSEWKSKDLLGNEYILGTVGPNQIQISTATKEALDGVGVDWGGF